MLTFLLVLFFIWMLGGFIGFAFKATWGLLKLLGIVIAIIAFPLLFFGVIVGVGVYVLLPLILIAIAAGCIAKMISRA